MTHEGEHIAMEPMRIAIVPYEAALVGQIQPDIVTVANAIQRQVSEHFTPVWGASAIVSAFPTVAAVPEGYSTVAITTQQLPLGRGGFHYPDGGAGAIVHYSPGSDRWTVDASHETLEMIADPLGVRYVFGPSLADDPDAVEDIPDGVGASRTPQGIVEYLVETCDPVEGNDYLIDGIRVSDFVFPAFYDASFVNQRYSFTYAAKRPFDLTDGGYISWSVNRPTGGVFQAFKTRGVLTWQKVAEKSPTFSRQALDGARPVRRGEQPRTALGAGRQTRTGAIGGQLARRGGPDPYREIIERLADPKQNFWKECYDDPQILLDELRNVAQTHGTDLPPNLYEKQTRIADQPEYQTLKAIYDRGAPINYDFSHPDDALALAGMFSR